MGKESKDQMEVKKILNHWSDDKKYFRSYPMQLHSFMPAQIYSSIDCATKKASQNNLVSGRFLYLNA
jgi:hypothetical protein